MLDQLMGMMQGQGGIPMQQGQSSTPNPNEMRKKQFFKEGVKKITKKKKKFFPKKKY